MACSHKDVPNNVPISTTRVMRCRDNHLHRIHNYLCTRCGNEAFQYPNQVQWLAYYNLTKQEKDKLHISAKRRIQVKMERCRSLDAIVYYKQMSPGFDYVYILRREARYHRKRGKGHYEEMERIDAA